MKKIVLLTNAYPFGIKETFLSPELNVLTKLALVDLVPTENFSIKEMKIRDNIPPINSLQLLTQNFYGVHRLKYLILSIFQKSTWKEFQIQYKRGKINAKSIYRIIGFISRGNYIYKNLEKLYKEDLKKKTNDLIFYSYWSLEAAYGISKLKEKYNVKAVSRSHGVDLYEYRMRGNISLLPMRYYILSNLDSMYTISMDGKDYISKNYNFHENILVSYLGSEDLGSFNALITTKPFTIVSCARMTSIKRIDYFVDVLKEFKREKVRWIHFGDGPERSLIEKKVKELNRNVEVELKGDFDHDKVLEFYSSTEIHLFVNTSSAEGVPVSIMEAISFGIPVIATDVGGTKEIVKNNISGICVSADTSSKEFYLSIKSVMEMDVENYSNLRLNTRNFWENKFNGNKNYLEFYNEISKEELSHIEENKGNN